MAVAVHDRAGGLGHDDELDTRCGQSNQSMMKSIDESQYWQENGSKDSSFQLREKRQRGTNVFFEAC
jgi:hypothetical protein